MNNIYIYISIIMATLFLIGTANAYGQSDFPNKYKVGTGSYYIDDGLTIKESDLFTDYKTKLGLSSSDSMVRTNQVVDEDGKFRCHYVLYNHGIKVQGSMMNVIGEQGIVKRLNGFWVGGTNVDTTNLISINSAISAAISYMGADKYFWEDESIADSLRPYPSVATLIIAHKGGTVDSLAGNYALCYKVQLTAIQPEETKNVYINAHTGEGYTMQDAFVYEHSVNDGKLWTWYDGHHNDLTSSTCNLCFNYWLTDLNRHIRTVDFEDWKQSYKRGARIIDNNNNWVASDTKTAASAQWGVERAFDYFKNVQGFALPFNDSLVVWINDWYHFSGPNAAFGTATDAHHHYFKFITLSLDDYNYPPPNDGFSMAMIGVLGHEFTHAMVYNSSDLGSTAYETDAGALNEGFADIFGDMIKRQTLGYNGWTVGEHTVNIKRHLDNPHLDSDPSPEIYQEPGYWSWLLDPHINSGVIRKWFYLLSEGGTFNGVTVQGIGTQKAARIAFNTFEWWLWSNVSYPKAADQLVRETVADWGGKCSFVTNQNINALTAVGFDVPGPWCASIHIKGLDIISTKYKLKEAKSWKVQLGNDMNQNGTYQWQYPADWDAHVNKGTLTVNKVSDFGSYDPGLITVKYTDDAGDVYTDSLWVRFSDVAWTPTDPVTNPTTDNWLIKDSSHQKELEVYPNPAQEYVKVKAPVACKNAQLSIYTPAGRVVKNQTVNGQLFKIDVQQLPAGIYFIKLQTGKQLFTQKLSIIH